MTKSKHEKEKKDEVEPAVPHCDDANSETDRVDEQKQCNSCHQTIDVQAKICHYCNRGQGFWGKHVGSISAGVSIAAIIISLVMMVLAIAQLLDARLKNVDASKALQTAENATRAADLALTQAQSAANEIKNLKTEADKLNRLLEKSVKLTSGIAEIQRKSILINEFMMTVINAQNDDRKSFDQLREWAKDSSYLLSSNALSAYETIINQHDPRLVFELKPPFGEGVDPSKFALLELEQMYQSGPSSLRPSLIEYIWKRESFSKRDKMEFLIEIIGDDESLNAVEYAGRYFRKGAELKHLKPLAIEAFLEWWEKNRDKFKE